MVVDSNVDGLGMGFLKVEIDVDGLGVVGM